MPLRLLSLFLILAMLAGTGCGNTPKTSSNNKKTDTLLITKAPITSDTCCTKIWVMSMLGKDSAFYGLELDSLLRFEHTAVGGAEGIYTARLMNYGYDTIMPDGSTGKGYNIYYHYRLGGAFRITRAGKVTYAVMDTLQEDLVSACGLPNDEFSYFNSQAAFTTGPDGRHANSITHFCDTQFLYTRPFARTQKYLPRNRNAVRTDCYAELGPDDAHTCTFARIPATATRKQYWVKTHEVINLALLSGTALPKQSFQYNVFMVAKR